MPFCKRIIAPKDVCKEDTKRQRVIFTDLEDVCEFALCSVLRQLSDLSRQSVSILEELEGELASVCLRSRTLESKVVNLQKHLSVLVIEPPPLATTNLDSESKRTGHFRSSWQQHVKVLGWWSRPECVQELHREAELNLQRLLQEFGEQLYDDTEATCSQGSAGTSGSSESAGTFRHGGSDPGCVGCEDQAASVVVFDHESGEHPRVGPPVPEKPHWLLRPIAPAHLLLTDATGEAVQIKGAPHPRFLALSSDPGSRCLPLRKTHSDLPHGEAPPTSSTSELMENMALMCSSWNGPRGSTFCPNWDSSFSPYLLNPDPVTVAIPQVRGEGRGLRSDDTHYRDRSFSIPADSGSFSPGGRSRGGEGHALSYPSSGSEQGSSPVSTSTRAATPMASLTAGQGRECHRSISLRKLKKKPLPPVRSVSLGKTGRGETPETRDQARPRSLCLPRDLCNSVPPDVILSSRPRPSLSDTVSGTESSLPSQSKSSNRHRSPSGSSTADVPPPLEASNTHGSSESLPSPLPSPPSQTSPSQLSPEFTLSPIKPARLLSPSSGYSSLSDTPTPTVVPTAAIMGPSPLGCRMRPKVPERKSSLTPASARERAARVRLSCEVPVSSLQDPAAGRAKTKAARRHSDCSSVAVAMVKLSPCQGAMPLVTETDLRNVRLRSVGLPESEAGAEGGPQVIPEEQDQAHSPVRTPNLRPKPPIAAKPVLPKRPLSLVLSPTPVSESPPASPKERPRPLPKRPLSLLLNPGPCLSPSPLDPTPHTAPDRPSPLGNIYKVLRKRKSKKSLAPAPPGPAAAQECGQQTPALDPQREAERPPSSSHTETRDRTRTLPSRKTVSCLAELDRKQNKVPPPVPRKPSVLLLPVNGVCGGVDAERALKAHAAEAQQDSAGPAKTDRVTGVDPRVKAPESGIDLSQDGPEEDYDDVFVTSTSHTTEDLFTIIHRSKRKVLGRKEPLDLFGSRQSLSSVGKTEAGSGTSRSSSRNDNFMAMLQKRNGRNGPLGRPTAAEMLQSTKPLAHRSADCPPPYPESSAKPPQH
ncbi:NHS-like protein 2 isoform X2 [Conger conger]|uniref:NHS-like protein 2 isoform X2 n=1 Tax=Conger conger TaxID=82655 RepID=UPI002A5A0E39|nr:NHS-like protein 2 isoform X2 [Conger conger]